MKKIIFVILLLFSLTYAQELKHVKDILQFSNSVLSLINEGKYIPALKLIRKYSINDKNSFKTKRLISYFKKRKTLGFLKIHEKDLFNVIFKVSFLQKFRKNVILIDFYFYKPDERWYLYDISIKNDIKSFF